MYKINVIYILNLTMSYDNYISLFFLKVIAILPVSLLWKKFIFLFIEIRKEKRDKDRQQIEW